MKNNIQDCPVEKSQSSNLFMRIFMFYYEGFRSMTIGKKLWIIILIKLFVMFFVLKLFFFPNFIKDQAGADKADQAEFVEQQLVSR